MSGDAARSTSIVVASSLAGGGLVAAVYGAHAGVVTGVLLAVVGGGALGGAHVAAARRARLGRLHRQFTLAVAIAIGSILVAVGVAVTRMFVSHHDALMVSVITVVIGTVAARAAQLFAGGVLRDVETVRDGLVAVGRGERRPRLRTESRDELGELAAAANAMVERLAAEEGQRDAAELARRDLVVAVSHDLRTPLASLRLLVDAIADGVVDGETRARYLREMRTHVATLSALIDDLFELSRLAAGDIEWSMQRVELDELVGETVAAMRAQAEAKRVAVIADLAPDLAPAQADPEKLQRVLFNLIQNAIRHTPADGSVTVRAAPTDDGVEIEVADTGAGIEAADRPRVFEPFFRGGSEASRTRDGAGLGLAIARAIVEAHGGRIWLEETPTGTCFRFTLPRRLTVAGGG
jgi:signal transduction histidine kinase